MQKRRGIPNNTRPDSEGEIDVIQCEISMLEVGVTTIPTGIAYYRKYLYIQIFMHHFPFRPFGNLEATTHSQQRNRFANDITNHWQNETAAYSTSSYGRFLLPNVGKNMYRIWTDHCSTGLPCGFYFRIVLLW